jgi:hypothetical protein
MVGYKTEILTLLIGFLKMGEDYGTGSGEALRDISSGLP